MLRKIYNALWGFRGKIFHIYYSIYRQNKALHMRFNEIEQMLIEIDSKVEKLTEPPLKVNLCNTPKRKPGRPKKKKGK